MSNIYIQEPPALGKVLLKTTVGDIDLELWTKEAPKACRNFIQLCMEGYYNGTIFHRVVPDFIVQGGDPKGDGTGGESVYGAPFKDEFHTRLRFNRRGLVAMANGGKDDNASQFFFTLNATPELQNKHTIFAKVTGETVFNMLKLAEGETDIEDRPMYPHKITDSQILVNPFDDIVPRVVEKQKEEPIDKKKKKEKGVKNFGLLSFGMEAEEEEDQFTEFRGKPKSTHDVLDDPKLSKLTSNDLENGDDVSNEFKEDSENTEAAVANIRGKLLSKKDKNADKKPEEEESKEVKSDEEIEEYYLGKDKKEARKKQAEEIRKQIKDLKREMSSKKNQIDELVSDKKSSEKKKAIENNELVEQFENEQKKYKKKMEELPKKGASRKKRSPLQQSNKKPWIKKLYENTGIYPDNYTDKRFLQEMRKNVNVHNVTFFQCFLGSCRVTQKLSTCVLFSVIFTYLYNEWTSPQFVFGASSVINFLGYIFFLTVNKRKIEEHKIDSETVGKNSNVEEFETDVKKHVSPKVNQSVEDIRADNLLSSYMERYTKRSTKKKHRLYSFDDNSISNKSIHLKVNNSFTKLVFDDLKMVLIYLVFGYIFSPILHTLTDTVSTDTIYATTIFMMIIHLIFSDYGISVAVVSNSFSINSIFFGSTCLASRLSTPFCAFVLLTVSVQAFVLSPILIKVMWNTNFAIFVFGATTLVTFISLWNVSRTMFFFFLFAVIFLNVYCPFLFIRWQKYKDNIYGPWDEAVVHDSDDISECIGVR